LDLVLIDGDHAFPASFIDWYYTAEQVKLGGYVIVDDTNLDYWHNPAGLLENGTRTLGFGDRNREDLDIR
jgi:hypothetical protein